MNPLARTSHLLSPRPPESILQYSQQHYENEEPIPEDLDDNQYVERYGIFQLRIDANHGEPHLNQDILGLSKKRQRSLMEEDWEDFHNREL